MPESAPRKLLPWFEFVPHVAAAIAVAVGVLAVAGWVFGVATLRSAVPGLTAVKVNTAVAFILSGGALLGTTTRRAGRLLHIGAQTCSAVVLMLALLTIAEYLSGANFGIDQLLVREVTHLPGDSPGRMALLTAISLAGLSAALLLGLRQTRLVVAIHALAAIPLILGGSMLIGYAYDIGDLLREKLDYTPMALPAAAVLVLLAFGTVTARPEYPLPRFVTSANAAGMIARRLLPAAILFTFVIGWLVGRAYRTGYLGGILTLALFTAVTITGLSGMILWGVRALYGAAIERDRAEDELRAASNYARSLIEASLDPLVMTSREGKITDVNEAAVRATGVPREVSFGTEVFDYFTDPVRARGGFEEALAKGFVTDFHLTLRHVSGSVMEVLCNASVYRSSKGEITGVFAAARDITARIRAEEALRASQELFRAFADATSEGMLIHEHGRVVELNRQMEDILRRPRAEVIGVPFLNFVAPAWFEMMSQRVETPEDTRIELAFLRPDGSQAYVSSLAHSCVYQGREMRVAAYRDITLEKRAEEALRTAGQYNRTLIEVSLDPLVTINPEGKITDVNEAAVAISGIPRTVLIGSDIADYFVEPDKARAGYQEVFAKGFIKDYPLSVRHPSGKVTEVLCNASIYRDAKGNVAGALATARDITERKKLERELEHQAHIDILTNLNNRRFFTELAEQELARAKRHKKPLSLMMMDIDHFKAVNDTHGHPAGDMVLQKLAEVCRNTFREIDIVGRMGGEEFAALLPETAPQQAVEVAERLRHAVEGTDARLGDGNVLRVTVSIGVARVETEDDKIDCALKRADTALYQAKSEGRNRVCLVAETAP